MSEQLIKHFDLLAQAPDGVARLRELILTLAVQGKLVPQDPNDEPASVLLQRIRAEKDRLIAEGMIKLDKPLQQITDDEKPFELQKGWAWVRALDVCILITDGDHQPPPKAETGVPFLVIGDVRTGKVELQGASRYVPESYFDSLDWGKTPRVGDILYTTVGSFGIPVPIVQKQRFCFQRHIALFRPATPDLQRYLTVSLQSRFAYLQAEKGATGIAQKTVPLSALRELLIPMPPLAEQSRIVARVEELMRLCDALEAKQQLDTTQHAQLVQTLLGTLTDSTTPKELASAWQRVATHFDLLLDRPEAVDALEQTILQLAVRGLLVPQDPTDEPASLLLQRVIARAAERTAKSLKACGDGIVVTPPYELPEGWDWCQLGTIVENMGSGWSPACDEGERSDSTTWAVLRTTAVQTNEYRARENKVLPPKLSPRPEIEVKNGDILITRAGPMNRVGVSCWVDSTPPRLMLSDKIVRFHSIGDEMLPAFIVLALNAGWTKSQIEDAKTGMAASQVNISQTELRGLWLPVCSKAEQSRIVARVEELRQICRDLRLRLTTGRTAQAHLAEALVEAVATT